MDPRACSLNCGGSVLGRRESTNAVLFVLRILSRPKGDRARVGCADRFDARSSGCVFDVYSWAECDVRGCWVRFYLFLFLSGSRRYFHCFFVVVFWCNRISCKKLQIRNDRLACRACALDRRHVEVIDRVETEDLVSVSSEHSLHAINSLFDEALSSSICLDGI